MPTWSTLGGTMDHPLESLTLVRRGRSEVTRTGDITQLTIWPGGVEKGFGLWIVGEV